jgi:hypothetical protein
VRYRVGWSASSNVTFSGHSDWEDWEDPDATADEIRAALTKSEGHIADGFELALEASGYEWRVDVEDGSADAGQEG